MCAALLRSAIYHTLRSRRRCPRLRSGLWHVKSLVKVTGPVTVEGVRVQPPTSVESPHLRRRSPHRLLAPSLCSGFATRTENSVSEGGRETTRSTTSLLGWVQEFSRPTRGACSTGSERERDGAARVDAVRLQVTSSKLVAPQLRGIIVSAAESRASLLYFL